MGAGMADFAALATPEQPVAEINSIADYDLYCHYVAGLVGEGLSGLFAASGKERSFIADQLTLPTLWASFSRRLTSTVTCTRMLSTAEAFGLGLSGQSMVSTL